MRGSSRVTDIDLVVSWGAFAPSGHRDSPPMGGAIMDKMG